MSSDIDRMLFRRRYRTLPYRSSSVHVWRRGSEILCLGVPRFPTRDPGNGWNLERNQLGLRG